MLTVRLPQVVLLKTLVESLKELIPDANWTFDPVKGLTIQSMDNSLRTLVWFNLSVNAFSEWSVDEPIHLGINHHSMSKLLKCAPNESVVVLTHNSRSNQLSVGFESKTTHSHFQIKLLDLAQAEPFNVPEQHLDYQSIVTMSSKEFQRTIKELSLLSKEFVTIQVYKDEIQFSSDATSQIGCTISYKTEAQQEPESSSNHSVQIELKEECRVRVSSGMLLHLVKATPLSDRLILKLAHDLPMLCLYRLDSNLGCLQFYVAPLSNE